MSHACNPNVWEAEAGGLPCVQGQPVLLVSSRLAWYKTLSKNKTRENLRFYLKISNKGQVAPEFTFQSLSEGFQLPASSQSSQDFSHSRWLFSGMKRGSGPVIFTKQKCSFLPMTFLVPAFTYSLLQTHFSVETQRTRR